MDLFGGIFFGLTFSSDGFTNLFVFVEYFATVLMNSPFASTNNRNNMRYIQFDGLHPVSFIESDMPTLRSVFFALVGSLLCPWRKRHAKGNRQSLLTIERTRFSSLIQVPPWASGLDLLTPRKAPSRVAYFFHFRIQKVAL